MKKVVVVAAARTAIGSLGGTLKDVMPEVLLSDVIKGVIGMAGIEGSLINEVIAGHVKQTSDCPNIARLSALMAGLPENIPGYTVQRQCGSGIQAIVCGMQQILCGFSETVLACGVESMSTAPFYIRGARFGIGNGNALLVDPLTEGGVRSQPFERYGNYSMIQTADRVASEYQVSREEQDQFACDSQRKAIAAIEAGRFEDEIIPIKVPQKKRGDILFDTDEYPKRNVDLEKLAALKPIYEEGTVTAGNASGRNDGAAAMIIMAEERAIALGLRPIAEIVGAAAAGVDPRVMGIGPIPAVQALMEKPALKGLTIDDFGLIELNEAFAAQALACIRELGLDPDRVNVNGGGIALGHPLGCTGIRISATLLHEMAKRDVRYGLATLCIGGGQGIAIAYQKY